jgi:hypothetical protein
MGTKVTIEFVCEPGDAPADYGDLVDFLHDVGEGRINASAEIVKTEELGGL